MFGPSESEPSEVGIGPIYSGMIWSGLLGDGDADADARPVCLSLFRTTFQSWNSVFLSQYFSISIRISQISASTNKVNIP